MTAEEIARALSAKRYGQGWICKCPAHDDKTPSLKIDETQDGKTILKCFAGCSQDEVIKSLIDIGLWEEKRKSNGKPSKKKKTDIYVVDNDSDWLVFEIYGLPCVMKPDVTDFSQYNKVFFSYKCDPLPEKGIILDFSPYSSAHEMYEKSPDSFLDDLEKAKKKKQDNRLLFTLAEILEEEINQVWLFDKYLLHQPQLTELYGDPSSGKTLIALDMALCLATYQPWAGIMPEIPGLSVYIYGEGRSMLKSRIQAWFVERGLKSSDLDDAPFLATKGPIQIGSEEDDIEKLISDIDNFSKIHGLPKLIIIDTLDKNMIGNENDTNDMKNFIHRISKNLIYKYQCNTMILHHPGHDNKERSRGASNLKGALDAQYNVNRKKNTDIVTLKTGVKVPKDYDAPKPLAFEINRYDFLPENGGKEYSGAAMKHIEYDEACEVEAKKGSKISMDALGIIKSNGSSMLMETWRSEFRDLGYQDRKQFSRAVEWLGKNGKIKIEGNIVSET